MELSTRQRLADLNRAFYAAHAEAFADARPRLAAGVQRVLARIPRQARVLEVGCGDGKVGRALARAGTAAYVGVDASQAMLDRARRYSPGMQAMASSFIFIQADLMDPGWTAAVPAGDFDWVLAFAVFHHLPGSDMRARVLADLAGLLKPGGTLAMSNWQFSRSQRLQRRRAAWALAGLEQSQVEPGDALLAWERKGASGLRYVHEVSPAETRALAASAALRVVETFAADGATADLTDYVLMQRGA